MFLRWISALLILAFLWILVAVGPLRDSEKVDEFIELNGASPAMLRDLTFSVIGTRILERTRRMSQLLAVHYTGVR